MDDRPEINSGDVFMSEDNPAFDYSDPDTLERADREMLELTH